MLKNKKTGIDIISKRFSAFEKKALKEILDLKKDDLIYELGSGKGNFSVVAAFLGKKTISLDLDFEGNFWKLKVLKKIFSLKNWSFFKKDISQMNYADFNQNISFVFSGRFLHYLKYSDTEKLLKILHKKTKVGAKLYFSVSGMDTYLAENYPGKSIEIEKRFFKISPDLQNRFSIKEKVCLYSETEVKELFSKYFKVIKIEKTAFGNINIVVERK